jgi:D-alanyl-D-alanine carboxypeptidase (penicillin-binding protein 5/6)
VDASSGEILLEYNADEKLFPASVTKIMTMLLVAEAIDENLITLADKVTCSQNAASKGGSQIWLEEGEVMTVDELLRATAIGSANDAATLLGEYVAGSEQGFIDMMNSRAKELGMNNTNFENTTGLDDATDTHLTTARDIAIMSVELLKHDFITEYTTIWMDSLRNGETELVNTNKLVRFYSGATGLKTGTTAKAGCCVSASAKRNGLHLVTVVMGSETSDERFDSAKALLDWGFTNYVCFKPEIDTTSFESICVRKGKKAVVEAVIPEINSIALKKGEETQVVVRIDVDEDLIAPVEKDQILGCISIETPSQKKYEYKITAKNNVEGLSFFDCIVKTLNFIGNGKKEYPSKPDNA